MLDTSCSTKNLYRELLFFYRLNIISSSTGALRLLVSIQQKELVTSVCKRRRKCPAEEMN